MLICSFMEESNVFFCVGDFISFLFCLALWDRSLDSNWFYMPNSTPTPLYIQYKNFDHHCDNKCMFWGFARLRKF